MMVPCLLSHLLMETNSEMWNLPESFLPFVIGKISLDLGNGKPTKNKANSKMKNVGAWPPQRRKSASWTCLRNVRLSSEYPL